MALSSGRIKESIYQVKSDKIELEKGSGGQTRAIIQLRESMTTSGRVTSPN